MQLSRRAGAEALPAPPAAWLDLLRRQLRDAASTLAERRIVALYYRGNLDGAEGQPLSLLYIGQEAHAPAFEIYLGGDGTRAPPVPEERFRGTLLDYLGPRGRAEADLDADVVVRQMFLPAGAHPGELLHLPFIDGLLPVAGRVEEQIQEVRSKAHRRRLRKVLRSASHPWRITKGPSDFELFYSTMYEPYVRQKFGLRAHLDSRETLGELLRHNGRILLVRHLDKPVCGSLLFESSSRTLFYHRNGFVDGASLPPLLLAQRTAALELALMQHASESGARLIRRARGAAARRLCSLSGSLRASRRVRGQPRLHPGRADEDGSAVERGGEKLRLPRPQSRRSAHRHHPARSGPHRL